MQMVAEALRASERLRCEGGETVCKPHFFTLGSFGGAQSLRIKTPPQASVSPVAHVVGAQGE